MGTILYTMEVSACQAVFFYIYYLLLRKETFALANRFYLLGALVLSFVIPLIDMEANSVPEGIYTFTMAPLVITGRSIKTGFTYFSGGMQVLAFIYYAGLVVMTGLFALRLIEIYNLRRKGRLIKEDGIKIILTERPVMPFSFMGTIYLNERDYNGSMASILLHECAHVRQRHTIDIIMAELAGIILWFNPFSYLFKKALLETHEFLADRSVISSGYAIANYSEDILSRLTGSYSIPLTNGFSRSLIKRRFEMMRKKPSGKIGRLKMFTIFPVIIVLMAFFGTSPALQQDKIPDNSKSSVHVKGGAAVVKQSDKESKKIDFDTPPEFKGDISEFLLKNIEYPEQAKKAGIEGTVYVKIFVNKKGQVTKEQISKGTHKLLNKEALRVAKLLPDFTPAAKDGKPVGVWLTLPIKFKLKAK